MKVLLISLKCYIRNYIRVLESDPSSVILQEETPRIRPYNYRSASERRCVYARYTRPTSGRYSAASSFADSFLDSATLSKCSSTSNLSDISSSTRDVSDNINVYLLSLLECVLIAPDVCDGSAGC